MSNPQTVRLGTHAIYLDDDGRDIAANVTYDPASSGLAATDVQAAIDEIVGGGTGGGGGGGGLMVPYYIPVGDTFTVPLYKQALFVDPIEVDGALVVNGVLIGVD